MYACMIYVCMYVKLFGFKKWGKAKRISVQIGMDFANTITHVVVVDVHDDDDAVGWDDFDVDDGIRSSLRHDKKDVLNTTLSSS
jgi:hypothetical protein